MINVDKFLGDADDRGLHPLNHPCLVTWDGKPRRASCLPSRTGAKMIGLPEVVRCLDLLGHATTTCRWSQGTLDKIQVKKIENVPSTVQ